MSDTESGSEDERPDTPIPFDPKLPMKQSMSQQQTDYEDEYESEDSEQEDDQSKEEEDEERDENENLLEEQKSEEMKPTSKQKTELVSSKPAIGAHSKLPNYETMVYESLKNIGDGKKGVSIATLYKYISKTYNAGDPLKKFFFKKAIDKGIADTIFRRISGIGLIGSIGISIEHKKKLAKIQQKAEKEALHPKAKAKPKPKPKSKSEEKKTNKKKAASVSKKPAAPVSKTASKDTNNKTKPAKAKKVAPAPKAKISKTTGAVRLSISPAQITTAGRKAKPKPQALPSGKPAKTLKDPAPAAKTTAPKPDSGNKPQSTKATPATKAAPATKAPPTVKAPQPAKAKTVPAAPAPPPANTRRTRK